MSATDRQTAVLSEHLDGGHTPDENATTAVDPASPFFSLRCSKAEGVSGR